MFTASTISGNPPEKDRNGWVKSFGEDSNLQVSCIKFELHSEKFLQSSPPSGYFLNWELEDSNVLDLLPLKMARRFVNIQASLLKVDWEQ